jgi:hypothetical protein
VSATYLRLDGGTVTTGTVLVTTELGAHVLDFWSVDAAGNVESPKTVNFTIEAPSALLGGAPPPLVGPVVRLDVPLGPPFDVVRAEPVV